MTLSHVGTGSRIMAPPKTVLDKIVHAVTKMADPTGSSRVAIVKFLKREFDLDNANAIKKALKQGVDKGSLVQKGQSFTIPGVEFQEPEDMKVSITEVTIGDGDVATKGSTVTMRYRGTLDSDGSEFDAGKIDFTLYAGEVIKGWDKGIEGMKVEGQARARHPSEARVRQGDPLRRSPGTPRSCSTSSSSPSGDSGV